MSRRVTASKRPTSPPAGQFTDKEFVERMKAYRKPPGHPQGTVCRMMPDSTHIRVLRMLIEASGVLPCLERRLRRSGPESRLTVLALLIALFYVAGEWNTYWRTYVACFFASLDPQDAVDLGVQPLDALLDPISYDVVCKQARRLEKALSEGWTDEDGTDCNLRWFTASLIEASVPPRIARQIEAVAMDATDVPSWADPWRQPDAQGRQILDPDATNSHRSANSEREPGHFWGYFLTPCIAVKARRRTRSTKKAKFGDDVPAYAVSMIFRTAAASVADSGLDAMEEALKLCPNISEVVADRGYTQLGPTFNRGIHRINIDITMDYKAPMAHKRQARQAGPQQVPRLSSMRAPSCTPSHRPTGGSPQQGSRATSSRSSTPNERSASGSSPTRTSPTAPSNSRRPCETDGSTSTPTAAAHSAGNPCTSPQLTSTRSSATSPTRSSTKDSSTPQSKSSTTTSHHHLEHRSTTSATGGATPLRTSSPRPKTQTACPRN